MPRDSTQQRRRAVHRRARRYITSHYRDPDLDLGDVAAAVGVSRRQLQRIFAETDPAGDFRSALLRVRMEAARALLTRSRNPLPAYRVAPRVGYRQVSGLRQAFKRYYGCNPSDVQAPPPDYDELWRATEQRLTRSSERSRI